MAKGAHSNSILQMWASLGCFKIKTNVMEVNAGGSSLESFKRKSNATGMKFVKAQMSMFGNGAVVWKVCSVTLRVVWNACSMTLRVVWTFENGGNSLKICKMKTNVCILTVTWEIRMHIWRRGPQILTGGPGRGQMHSCLGSPGWWRSENSNCSVANSVNKWDE